MTEHLYNIADWKVRICFADEDEGIGMHLLPSFSPFSIVDPELEELFTITIDQSLEPDADGVKIKDCDTNNGIIEVVQLRNGGYRYISNNTSGEACAMMQCNADCNEFVVKLLVDRKDQRHFGLNTMMMLAYAVSGACHGTLLIHASLVRKDGVGYAFVAKSGTGKSTQTANWLKVIPGCDLMNDDNPIVRMVDGKAMIYGSPWSGKTPCYRQVNAPLGAVTLIARDSTNWVEKISGLMGFKQLITSCSAMKWDKKTYSGVCDTVSEVVASTGSYILHCTADAESAKICYEAIGRSC